VAGWFDGGNPGERGSLFTSAESERGADRARTVIIECKQSRSDFLRDDADREELLRVRAHHLVLQPP